MTVTFRVAAPDIWVDRYRYSTYSKIEEILSRESAYRDRAGGEILQTSEQDSNRMLGLALCRNGFIGAVYQACSGHHDLVIRPDDVWVAILVQFSAYVNGNAEDLRYKFVNHERQKECVVIQMATLRNADSGKMSREMTEGVQKQLVDGDTLQWILPNFTTTQEEDATIASAVMMAIFRGYLKYRMMGGGIPIPNVTLLGEPEDWEKIRERVEKLPAYDLHRGNSGDKNLMSAWRVMLLPILDEFIKASEGKPNVDFWAKICHMSGGHSGPSYLSGWISAFNVFDNQGIWRGNIREGEEWPQIDSSEILDGYVHLPAKIHDEGTEYNSWMFAGHIAYEVQNQQERLQPRLDWAIALEVGAEQRADPAPRHCGA